MGDFVVVRFQDLDFTGYDIIATAITTSSPEECARQAYSHQPQGRFYTWISNINACWIKQPIKSPRGASLVGINMVMLGLDFPDSFDYFNDPTAANINDCFSMCQGHAGCAVASFNPSNGDCGFKIPNAAKGSVTGYWYFTPGRPASPSPLPPSSPSPSPNPPLPVNLPPSSHPTTAAPIIVQTVILTAILETRIVTATQAQTNGGILSTSTTKAGPSGPQDISSTLNTGMIGGIAAALVLCVAALGLLFGRKRSQTKALNLPTTLISSPFQQIHKDPAVSVVSDSSILPPTPPAQPIHKAEYAVTAVPGFYCATVDHEAQEEGQVSLKVGQRVYVTSMPDEKGWCKGLVAGSEGWVHASMLMLLG
ncbi:UNVERIFIED_CONTAM: hypothetical protein HDU68_005162 [Siphonaria sp. JEL0065]|nr:hypothetical protein HDU68_005162 [Siphonaria sp. JEL0065]